MSKRPARTALDAYFGTSDAMAAIARCREAELVPLLRSSAAHRSRWAALAAAGGAHGFAAPGVAILAWAG
jgi:CelD/BcsL family acetyltransferase involved in cellulose biosynthesis